jgi:hypothetical protein
MDAVIVIITTIIMAGITAIITVTTIALVSMWRLASERASIIGKA